MHLFCSNFWMFTNCCCQCKRDSKKSSLLAELASIPTSFVAFLYMLQVAKYFCMIHLSDLGTLVFDKIIAYFWTWCFIINKAFLSTMLTCADNTLWNTTHFMKRYVCMFAFIIRVVTKYCITHPISYHFIHILIRHVKTVTSAVHKKMIHMRQ